MFMIWKIFFNLKDFIWYWFCKVKEDKIDNYKLRGNEKRLRMEKIEMDCGNVEF